MYHMLARALREMAPLEPTDHFIKPPLATLNLIEYGAGAPSGTPASYFYWNKTGTTAIDTLYCGSTGAWVACNLGGVAGALGLSVPTGQTAVVTDVDSLTEGGVIVPTTLTFKSDYDANSVDKWAFTANRALKILGITEVHAVAGSDGGTVTLDVRKVTSVDLPGAAASSTVKEFLTAAFNLKSTANTVVAGTLSATAADITLASGDKIGLNFVGTLTALVGGVVTVSYKYV